MTCALRRQDWHVRWNVSLLKRVYSFYRVLFRKGSWILHYNAIRSWTVKLVRVLSKSLSAASLRAAKFFKFKDSPASVDFKTFSYELFFGHPNIFAIFIFDAKKQKKMNFSTTILFSALVFLSLCQITQAFSFSSIASKSVFTRKETCLSAGSDSPPLDDRTRERIEKLVKSNKVLLFMKGNKLFPQWWA